MLRARRIVGFSRSVLKIFPCLAVGRKAEDFAQRLSSGGDTSIMDSLRKKVTKPGIIGVDVAPGTQDKRGLNMNDTTMTSKYGPVYVTTLVAALPMVYAVSRELVEARAPDGSSSGASSSSDNEDASEVWDGVLLAICGKL